MIILMDYNNYTWDKGDTHEYPDLILLLENEGIGGYPVEAVGRRATIGDYNKWLRSCLRAGYNPTEEVGRPWAKAEMYYVTNPETAPDLSNPSISFDPRYATLQTNGVFWYMCGTSSRTFIIPKQYNYSTYAQKFDVGHNTVFGWENGEPVSNKGDYVPVYSDTIDKAINQKKADKEYQKLIRQAKKQASRINPNAAYTVDEVLYLLGGLPDDFVVRGLRVTPE